MSLTYPLGRWISRHMLRIRAFLKRTVLLIVKVAWPWAATVMHASNCWRNATVNKVDQGMSRSYTLSWNGLTPEMSLSECFKISKENQVFTFNRTCDIVVGTCVLKNAQDSSTDSTFHSTKATTGWLARQQKRKPSVRACPSIASSLSTNMTSQNLPWASFSNGGHVAGWVKMPICRSNCDGFTYYKSGEWSCGVSRFQNESVFSSKSRTMDPTVCWPCFLLMIVDAWIR